MATNDISVQNLRDFYRSETTLDDWLYQEAIDAAKAYLRSETGREFVLVTDATTATERVYAPVPGADFLRIHDAASITSVTEDGTALTSGTSYVATPHNNLTDAGEYAPYSRLYRLGGSWFTDGANPTVAVTAKWGWTSFPAGYRIAGLVCAKAYLMARDVNFGLVAITDAGVAGERDAKAVTDFVSKYRNVWGIA